jgi:E3 ubiquitin-protein ligase TRIP12
VAETVVGATSGAVPPPNGYFKGVAQSSFFFGAGELTESAMKSVCDKYGALLILDEVRPICIAS